MTVACYYTAKIRELFHRVWCGFVYINVSSAEWAISALSSAKSSYLTIFKKRIVLVFVFALKCATVKRFVFWCDWM